jgi:hypothetical protein
VFVDDTVPDDRSDAIAISGVKLFGDQDVIEYVPFAIEDVGVDT